MTTKSIAVYSVILFVSLSGLSLAADEAASATRKVTKDIPYRTVNGQLLLLDLYQPKDAGQLTPVIAWVHGGSWQKGSKDKCPITWLCDHGFAVASIEYRLTSRAIWPAQIEDCRAAVAFLRSNAAKYQLAPRIGVVGGSAGGHVVALMGTLDQSSVEKKRSGVQAVCDFFGPTDLLTMPNNVVTPEKSRDDLASVPGAKLLGGIVSERPERAKAASAFHQASVGDAPMLIIHGDTDKNVPLEQSRRLHKRLKEVGSKSQLIVVEGAGHGLKQFQTDDVRNRIVKFFRSNLVGDTTAPVKHLFVAKLLLKKMETVAITPQQTAAFNQLSADLRTLIDKKRKDVGITKQIIKRRDEVYKKLKTTNLKGDAFWQSLQEQANITTEQRQVFRETQQHYATFRAAALKLLTDEQRARLPKGKRQQ